MSQEENWFDRHLRIIDEQTKDWPAWRKRECGWDGTKLPEAIALADSIRNDMNRIVGITGESRQEVFKRLFPEYNPISVDTY